MMDKKRLSVLVIGGAGYIGSHAARELRRRGYNAIIYDNLCTGHRSLAEGSELIVGDISDAAKLNSALQHVDAVMHFAAHADVGESASNPRKYFQNNVVDALSLLNAVIDSSVRKFIFSSTCATYGVPKLVPITEKTPRLPINPYGPQSWHSKAHLRPMVMPMDYVVSRSATLMLRVQTRAEKSAKFISLRHI